MKTVLLIGGTGNLGGLIGRRLLKRGLGGQLKTGNLWTAQNRQFPSPAETL